MTFLIFSQLPESVFRLNFSGKHFPENQDKFFFDLKLFSVDRKLFSNDTQTQKNLKSNFPKLFSRKQTWSWAYNLYLGNWKNIPHFLSISKWNRQQSQPPACIIVGISYYQTNTTHLSSWLLLSSHFWSPRLVQKKVQNGN